MFNMVFKSKKAVDNPLVLRDIMIEFLEDIKKGIKDKTKIDEIIKKISITDFSIQDAVSAYKDVLELSEESIHDRTLQYNGHQIPTSPFKPELIKKIKEKLL